MLDKIEQIDRDLLLWINGQNSPFFDSLMWQVSHQIIWIPLYLFFIIYAFRKLELKGLTTVVKLFIKPPVFIILPFLIVR